MRAIDALRRHPARRVEAVERRVGRLAGGRVLAGGLAELLRTPLRRRGCRRRSGTRGRAPRRSARSPSSCAARRAGHDRAGRRGRADQRAGLARVHRAQPVAVERAIAEPAASRSIAWPPTMPHGPAASATMADRVRAFAAPTAGSRGLARQQRERLGEQRVARQDRLPFAVDDVARSAARAAACRRPSPAGRRGPASRCGSARARTRRAAPARAPRPTSSAVALRRPLRPRRARGSAAAACRRRTGCSASPRRRAAGRRGRSGGSARARRPRRCAARRARRGECASPRAVVGVVAGRAKPGRP